MASQIQVLIDALWQGRSHTQQARSDLQGLGAAGGEAAIRMAATEARSRDLDRALRDLGQEVAAGRLSVEQAADAWEQYQAQLTDVGQTARRTETAVEQTGQRAQSSGLKWANVAGALYTVQAGYQAVMGAAEEVYETIREGAELDWGERRFENLARGIRSSSDELLGAMEANTRGLLSQADTMAMAADLIGLRLVDTVEEASRLSGVVAGLGMDLNQLTLTLTNQTTMRFDQLGVAVGGFDEKLEALEEQGYSTDKAFLWAFIQQAEESMARSGSRADTLAGQLDILEAAWADNVASIKRGLAEVAAPLIDWLASSIVEAQNAAAAIRDLRAAIDELGGDEAAVEEARQRTSQAVRQAVAESPTFLGAPVGLGTRQQVMEFALLLTEGTRTVEEQETILRRYGFTVDDIGFRLQGLGHSWVELNRSLRDQRIEERAHDTRQWSQYTREAAGSLENLSGVIYTTQAAMEISGESHENTLRLMESEQALLDALARGYVLTEQAQAELIEEGIAAWREYQAALEEVNTVAGRDFMGALEAGEEAQANYNQRLFEGITALESTPEIFMAAGLALTDYSEETLAAALRQAAMNEAIGQLAPLIADGTVSVESAVKWLQDLETQLEEDYSVEMDTQELVDAQILAQGVKDTLDSIRGDYKATVSISVSGNIPAPITGPGTPYEIPEGAFPGNAAGATYFPGGLTWVGEQGPELVALPRGSRIWSNMESGRMAGGMGESVINDNRVINIINRDREAAALAMGMVQLERRRATDRAWGMA